MDKIQKDKVIYYLKANGWTEDRCVDITAPQKYLENLGYVLFAKAREFLTSFYGLKFYCLTPAQAETAFKCRDEFGYEPSIIDFITEESHMRNEKWISDKYSEYLNAKTIPIGQCEASESNILIDECGRFYLANDGCIIRKGNDIFEFIDNYVCGRRFPIEHINGNQPNSNR